MVRYYGIHSRRVKKGVREVMEKLGLVVKYIIKPFSWRKNIEEYTGKDPLKCEKCGGEMLLYKIIYHDKNGVLKEYGGIDMVLRKITIRSKMSYEQEEEKQKKAWDEKREKTEYYQLCMC